MNIYHYHPETREYVGITEARSDPLETAKTGQTVYLIPAHATTDQPPQAGSNQVAIRTNEAWELVDDYRGREYWNKDTGEAVTITELGVIIPNEHPTQAPPIGMFSPKWDGRAWIETAIVYQGKKVESKSDVDLITGQRVSAQGEEKAKTEKLLAGSNPCPIWEAFIIARAAILQEGDEFITTNNLI